MGSRIVAGVDLGGTKCLGVLADLGSNVVHTTRIELSSVGGAEAALAGVCRHLAQTAQSEGHQIEAVGIGVPAVIDPASGIAVRGPNTGWDGFNVLSLTSSLDVPTVLDNDVNLAALGEQAVGAGQGHDDFAVLAIGTGLGGAVIAGGRLLRGAGNGAGEFGILSPPASAFTSGDLESVVSGVGIAQAARAHTQRHPEAIDVWGTDPDARTVFAAALRGDPHAEAVLTPVLDGVAACIVALSAIVDPDLVVLDGSVGSNLTPFLPRIDERVARHLETLPILTCSALRPTATVAGAVQQALALVSGPDSTTNLKENTHG